MTCPWSMVVLLTDAFSVMLGDRMGVDLAALLFTELVGGVVGMLACI
jgi:hypothetical protein